MTSMMDLQSSELIKRPNEFTPFSLNLLAYTYRVFKVIESESDK